MRCHWAHFKTIPKWIDASIRTTAPVGEVERRKRERWSYQTSSSSSLRLVGSRVVCYSRSSKAAFSFEIKFRMGIAYGRSMDEWVVPFVMRLATKREQLVHTHSCPLSSTERTPRRRLWKWKASRPSTGLPVQWHVSV